MNEKIFDDEIVQNKINEIIKKFPNDQPKSSIIESLLFLQERNSGYVSESIMKQLSDYLKVELIDVMEVATFYSMINTKPVGKNVISVCNNVTVMDAPGTTIRFFLEIFDASVNHGNIYFVFFNTKYF